MNNIIGNFFKTLSLIRNDKVIFLYSLVPVILGMILFYFAGAFTYNYMIDLGDKWISEVIQSGTWGTIVTYLFRILLTIVLYFVTSWTFVLIVSIIASPFNDLLSSRVEKTLLGSELPKLGESMGNMFKKIRFTVFNEVKKVIFIVGLSTVAFIASLIPLLAPISIFVSAILMVVSFVDYSWSRHELKVSDCVKDIKDSFVVYCLTGVAFVILISIPFVNIMMIPIGVIYYTIIFTQKKYEKISN